MSNSQRIISAVAFIVITLFILRKHKKLCIPITAIYLLVMIYVLFCIRHPYQSPRYALNPFRALLKIFILDDEGLHIQKWAYQGIVLNILLFVPFGYILPILRKKVDRFWKILLLGFTASLAIELIQYYTQLGLFDIDDLINNTIGSEIGWLCYKAWLRKTH